MKKENSVNYEVHSNQSKQIKLFLMGMTTTLGMKTSEICLLLVHIKTTLLHNVVDMIKSFTSKSLITSPNAGCIDQNKHGFYRNTFLKYLK